MTNTPVERWMLPDGIEEILPPEAHKVDSLRRSLLDVFGRWGYELVIPPMMEFTDSLLVGLGKDVDLLTFKVTDQLSGRSMGIRADMTPQIARMDAHSMNHSGVNRLCYSGHVLKTRVSNALDTRSPIQVGAELFGEPGIAAEQEILSLLVGAFDLAHIPNMCLDLGHVGIYRALVESAGLSSQQDAEYFELLQAKALTDLSVWVKANISCSKTAAWFLALPRMTGTTTVLAQARETFEGAPDEVFAALDELESVAQVITERHGGVRLYFDLSELTGYHYLTGIVFAAFVEGQGTALARGGRYDHIGEVFGRARSAIGFTADLVGMSRLSQWPMNTSNAIFAPFSENPDQWQAIQALRAQGEVVVSAMAKQVEPQPNQHCDRILTERDGKFIVEPKNASA